MLEGKATTAEYVAALRRESRAYMEALRHRRCRYCGGSGRVTHHGSGLYATLRACPVCSTGETLADTTIPNVTGRQEP